MNGNIPNLHPSKFHSPSETRWLVTGKVSNSVGMGSQHISTALDIPKTTVANHCVKCYMTGQIMCI